MWGNSGIQSGAIRKQKRCRQFFFLFFFIILKTKRKGSVFFNEKMLLLLHCSWLGWGIFDSFLPLPSITVLLYPKKVFFLPFGQTIKQQSYSTLTPADTPPSPPLYFSLLHYSSSAASSRLHLKNGWVDFVNMSIPTEKNWILIWTRIVNELCLNKSFPQSCLNNKWQVFLFSSFFFCPLWIVSVCLSTVIGSFLSACASLAACPPSLSHSSFRWRQQPPILPLLWLPWPKQKNQTPDKHA